MNKIIIIFCYKPHTFYRFYITYAMNTICPICPMDPVEPSGSVDPMGAIGPMIRSGPRVGRRGWRVRLVGQTTTTCSEFLDLRSPI